MDWSKQLRRLVGVCKHDMAVWEVWEEIDGDERV